MASPAKRKVSARYLWVFRIGIGMILLSALLFLLGFATDHWHNDDVTNYGLWEECQRGKCTRLEITSLSEYHIVTRVFQILATVIYALSPIVHFVMYWGKKKKTNDYRTRIFDVGFSAGAVAHFISVIVFGLKHPLEYLSWSYNMSGAGLGLCAVGVFLTTISREKALRIFDGLPGCGPKHLRNNRVGNSRPDTPLSNNSLSTQRSIQSRDSINAVLSPSSQQRTIFFTGASRGLPGTNINGQITTTDSLLKQALRPSTMTQGQLAPLRGHPLTISTSAPQDIAL